MSLVLLAISYTLVCAVEIAAFAAPGLNRNVAVPPSATVCEATVLSVPLPGVTVKYLPPMVGATVTEPVPE